MIVPGRTARSGIRNTTILYVVASAPSAVPDIRSIANSAPVDGMVQIPSIRAIPERVSRRSIVGRSV